MIYFKGISNLKIDFKHETNIHGENGTGKTTIMDAFMWLLFGKDSTGRKDFNVKTLDEQNQAIERVEHTVKGIFEIDGVETTLTRTMKDRWVKKKGEEEQTFEGNETAYFWNDVPFKQSQFQARVHELMPEELFKLLTDPMYFNNLAWKQRRAVLGEVAGKVEREEIFNIIRNDGFDTVALELALKEGKTIAEYKSEISVRKKKIKEEMKGIPDRIDEVKRAIPMPLDYDMLRGQLDGVNSEIKEIDKQLTDFAQADRKANENYRKQQQRISNLENKLHGAEQARSKEFTVKKLQFESDITILKRTINHQVEINSQISDERSQLEKSKQNAELAAQTLRNKWIQKNASEFQMNSSETHCGVCKQELPNLEIKEKELLENFQRLKSDSLARIVKSGEEQKANIEKIEADILKNIEDYENGKKRAQKLEKELSEKELQLSNLIEPLETKEEIDLKNEIKFAKENAFRIDGVDTNDLQKRKDALEIDAKHLQSELLKEEQTQKANQRVIELEEKEKVLGSELADQEKIEFSIEQFTRAEIEEIDRRTNQLFSIVKFRMFKEQINGGFAETCDCMIDGVPFSDLNSAGKIKAGLDIICTLSKHHDKFAPVFIDNRESVTTIPECLQTQIINLYVNPDFDKLTVFYKQAPKKTLSPF